MNYRHAFHAGNFADCMKHTLLVWLLRALMRKPAPIFVLDTHAGAGSYDLDEEPARRTNESSAGIRRLLDDPPAALADYVALVRQCGLYPGSPALIRAMLRPDDRLACCELRPDDAALLRRRFGRDPQVAVHQRDGWEALNGLLPPREKRGLVLIDPPFEDPREFNNLVAGIRSGHARSRGLVFAAWYPIKHHGPVHAFMDAMEASGIRDIVAAELWLREPLDPTRLNGCGLLIINPPYAFEIAAPAILSALLERLGAREDGEGWDLARIADE
jgi:23S rRNA (adenine2030-N6)-methyltransferase